MAKINQEEFVTRAITLLEKKPCFGIHRVSSGFDEAFRMYFKTDPHAATAKLAAEGKIEIHGDMLFLANLSDRQKQSMLATVFDFKFVKNIAEKVSKDVQSFSDAYIKSIVSFGIREIIRNDISGKVIGVTGDGPFEEKDIEELIEKLSAVVDKIETRWGEQEYIIIGRKDFDRDYLMESTKQEFEIKYLSQEDFINFLIFGKEAEYVGGDERIISHPGLSFLASIGFEWPSTFSEPGTGELPGTEEWPEESVLKMKYGYNVQEGTLVSRRRESLRVAVKGLGLEKVADHVAAMIRLNKRRSDNKMERAIHRWEEDLRWLKNEYYDKGAYRFFWPRH